MTSKPDIPLWKYTKADVKNSFVTKNTWHLIRLKQPTNTWYKGVWFTHANPKFSFIVWLAIHKRLTTGDKMTCWNQGVSSTCSLCGTEEDTCNHLVY